MLKDKKIKGKYFKVAAALLGIAALILSFLFGFFLRGSVIGKDAITLSEISALLKEYGVFNSVTGEITEYSFEDAAYAILNDTSDGYATYYSPEEYKKVKNNLDGNYEGIGLTVEQADGLRISRVTINSPAFYAGLKAGDVLTGGTFNGVVTEFDSVLSLTEFIGKAGKETFSLRCSRAGEETAVNLKKAEYVSTYALYKDSESAFAFLGDKNGVSLKTVDGAMIELPTDTAYIRLDCFEGDAASEIKRLLDFMDERGKTKLILDLRDNPGGSLSVLSDICGSLIYNGGTSGFPIMYAKNSKNEFSAFRSNGNYFNKNVTAISVIANERSASASECLIGAMLYYGGAFTRDALIIENKTTDSNTARTYGKGIMQTTFNLSGGGALKLTTATVYQPDKTTCIHGVGITVSGENAVSVSDNSAISRAIAALS